VDATHSGTLSERTPLTDLPAWQALLRHLSLASGADVLFLITPDASGAKACRRELEKSRTVRNLEANVPNDPAGLYDVLDAAAQDPQPVISWIELPEDVPYEALPDASAAWDQAFAALNPHRNLLLQEIIAPIIFAGPPWMFQSFRSHAPDWFSVRAGVFDLTRDIEKALVARLPAYSEDGLEIPPSPVLEIPCPVFPSDLWPPNGKPLRQLVEKLPAPESALFQTLSWLDPEYPVPLWLLAAHPTLPGAAGVPETLDALTRAGLVRRSVDGNWLRIHPASTTTVSRTLIDKDERGASLGEALEMLRDASLGDPQNPTTWSGWLPAAPHVRRIIENAESLQLWAPTVDWCNRLGSFYVNRADYTAAEPLLRKAQDFATSKLDSEYLLIGTTLNNLATLLQATNRLSEAEPLIREALRIDRAAFGENQPAVAVDLNNLAQLLKATNRLSEAEPLMRETLRIDRAAYGEDHPVVAVRLNNLAQLLKDTNRLSEAEPLMREALRIDRAAYGEGHPVVARDLNNLAQLLQDTNRQSEAEPLMRDALRILHASLGPEHPHTKIAAENLDLLLAEM